jgi:hypothetical protein
MRRALASAAAALAVLAVSPAADARAQSPAEAEQLGRQAYQYGFPLLDLLRIRREETSVPCPDGRGNAPVNHIANASKFATPADRTVVAPNTDTLYSIAHLDLGKGPVILRHPDMGKRFFDFELVDPYTNVIGYVGTRTTGSGHGRFAIAWNEAPGEGKPNVPVIKSKYRRVWLIGRTLAGDLADQKTAFRLMNKYKLAKPNGKRYPLPADCYRGKGEPATYPTPTDGPGFITSLNRAMAKNPPPKRDDPFLAQLAPLGIGPGLSPADVDLPADVRDALYAGIEAEAAELPGKARLDFLQKSVAAKGWITAASNIGAFGVDYFYRALIAVVGIGANTPEEAIYPATLTDSDGELLNGSRNYRMVFEPDRMPPARYFWSLTMYDFAGYLVDNPIDRYSLGPSHPPLVEKPDGSIVVAVQTDEPTEADVNWLPSPPGAFRLNMRLYGPRKAALNWKWRPPPVVRVP